LSPSNPAGRLAYGNLAQRLRRQHPGRPAGEPVGRPPPPYDWADPELPGRLDQALRLWAEDAGLFGAAAAVRTPDWLEWSGSFGVQNLDSGLPYEADTLGRIASATKSFTSTLILQLVDEGRLCLDATLSAFVRDYPNGRNITVDHLLRHRSGIPEVQLVDGFFILSILIRPHRWIPPGEILEWTYIPLPILDINSRQLVPRGPVSEPGGEYHYSQPGYIALGMIVEKITGRKLADVYRERIAAPLGLTGTRLPVPGDPLEPAGYTNSASWSAGGMLSTAGDLAAFLAAMLEGRLFSAQALAKATDWREIEPGDIVGSGEYGMGLFRNRHETYTTIGHDGALPGGGSVMKYLTELDVYVGAVTNTDRDWGDFPTLEERVRRALLKEDQGD